jgi:hypothetical protein
VACRSGFVSIRGRGDGHRSTSSGKGELFRANEANELKTPRAIISRSMRANHEAALHTLPLFLPQPSPELRFWHEAGPTGYVFSRKNRSRSQSPKLGLL